MGSVIVLCSVYLTFCALPPLPEGEGWGSTAIELSQFSRTNRGFFSLSSSGGEGWGEEAF